MTRNSAQTPDSDDPWGQLEADLFGVEVGKEHTAHERVASEELLEVPPQASIAIPKPLEDDDFGDFGAGLVEELAPAPRVSRRSESSVQTAKSSAQPERSAPADRPARAERARKQERAEEVTPAERSEKADRPTRAERPAAPDRSAKAIEPVEAPPARSAASVGAKAPPKKPAKDDFVDFDFDGGPTDEDLDASVDEDDVDDVDEVEAKSPPSPEDDPYWDALANWNWQEDDRSGKPRASEDRSRPASSSARGDRGSSRGRSDRGRPDRSSADRTVADRTSAERPSSERPSAPSRESRTSSVPEERPVERTSAARRSAPDRDRSERERAPERERNEAVDAPRAISPAIAHEPESEDVEESIDVTSRRRDRRRSRRQGPATTTPETPKTISLNALDPDFEPADEAWPQEVPEPRAVVSDPRARIIESDLDFDEPSIDEDIEATDSEETSDDVEGQPRRKRGRRRRRRPDRPDSAKSESSVDEDLKHLEDESFDIAAEEDLDGQPADAEGEEESAEDRAKRPRRRRRRGGRSDRPERPAAVPAARVEPELDMDEEDDLEEDPFVDESDLDFEEEEAPRKRPVRQRSARTAPTVRKTVDEDEDEGEPEPQVSYDDVPSWEEAISYLLNPSMVEATAGDRTSQERGVENRGAERVPERVDRGRPAAERAPRENGPRENGPRESGPREGGSRPPRRGPRRDA